MLYIMFSNLSYQCNLNHLKNFNLLIINLWLILYISLIPYTQAETWQAQLSNGNVLQVDSQTRRPVLKHHDHTAPLWDGVHKLQNNSIVIIKNGVVVPNEKMYQSWLQPPHPKTKVAIDPCELLVRRVCGLQGNCSTSQSCDLAQQLQTLEGNVSNTNLAKNKKEQADKSAKTAKSAKANQNNAEQRNKDKNACRKALLDVVTFPPCGQDAQDPNSACAKLVTKTCGNKSQCKSSSACDAAQQLMVLEQQALLNGQSNNTDCMDALDNAFFVTCQ